MPFPKPDPHFILPLYWERLKADTSHLNAQEFGVYLRLLLHQWQYGGVDGNNIARLSQIAGVTPASMRTAWQHVGPYFNQTCPCGCGQVRNASMETKRSEQQRRIVAARTNGAQGGRPPKNPNQKPMETGGFSKQGVLETQTQTQTETQTKPSEKPSVDQDPRSSRSVPVPSESVRTELPQKPGSAGAARALSLIQPRDKSAFWEGPVFNIPQKWAAKALKAANGSMSEDDLTRFARDLSARVEETGIDLTSLDFLRWLDDELKAYRGAQRANDSGDRAMLEAEARRRSVRGPR